MTVSKAFSRVLSRSVHHQSLELDEVDSVGFVKPVGSSSIVTPAQETADVLYPSASVDSRFAPDAKRIIGILSSSDSDGETVAARAKPKKRPAELASRKLEPAAHLGSLTPASASSHSTCSVKGEIRAKSEVGLHARASLKFDPCQSGTKDEGDSTLRWAVIRPSDKSEDHADKVKVKREKVGAVKLEQRVAAQTLKRLRSGVTRVAVSGSANGGSANGSKANDVMKKGCGRERSAWLPAPLEDQEFQRLVQAQWSMRLWKSTERQKLGIVCLLWSAPCAKMSRLDLMSWRCLRNAC